MCMSENNNIQIRSIDDAKDEIQRLREFVTSTEETLSEIERVSEYKFGYEARLEEVREDVEDVKEAVRENLAEFEQYECDNPREMKPLQYDYKELVQRLNRRVQRAEAIADQYPSRDEYEAELAAQLAEQRFRHNRPA